MFSVDSLKGLKKRAEFSKLPDAVAGEITGGPAAASGEPTIVSRAIKCGDEEGEHINRIKEFADPGDPYVDVETQKPTGPCVEGYQLSDGSFITCDEARERFANADIGPWLCRPVIGGDQKPTVR